MSRNHMPHPSQTSGRTPAAPAPLASDATPALRAPSPRTMPTTPAQHRLEATARQHCLPATSAQPCLAAAAPQRRLPSSPLQHRLPAAAPASAPPSRLTMSPPLKFLSAGLAVLFALSLHVAADAQALPGSMLDQHKISAVAGGFSGTLHDGDGFGTSVIAVGDVDGDGITDLAVGAQGDDDGLAAPHPDQAVGALWILFMNPDGSVRTQAKLSATHGNLTGLIDVDDRLGSSLAALGDLNGDGVPDLAAGLPNADDSGLSNSGAVLILFLAPDGSAAAHARFASGKGGFVGPLALGDGFGSSLALIDSNPMSGVVTLAVGTPRTNGSRGEVWIVRVDRDGNVRDEQLIAPGVGGFAAPLDPLDFFGASVAGLGDLDGDGTADLAVGVQRDDDGGASATTDRGAVWVLLLAGDLTVKSAQKISATAGGFVGAVDSPGFFGSALACLGDVDADGVPDLAVGAPRDDSSHGSAWVLMLARDGHAKSYQKITNLWYPSYQTEFFGGSLGALRDVSGDGRPDLAVGIVLDDDGGMPPGANIGAIRLLTLSGPPDPGWTDLGYSLPLTGGPALAGTGELLGNTLVQLAVTDAPKQAAGLLLAGSLVFNLPFAGGLMIPNPAIAGLAMPFVTDAAGIAAMQGRWPPGLPGETLVYLQAWFHDPGTPSYRASNALAAKQY